MEFLQELMGIGEIKKKSTLIFLFWNVDSTKNSWNEKAIQKVETISHLADIIGVSKQYMSKCLKEGKNTFEKYGVKFIFTKDEAPPKHGYQFTNLETGVKSEIYRTIADAARGIGMSYQTFYRNRTWPKIVRKNKS